MMISISSIQANLFSMIFTITIFAIIAFAIVKQLIKIQRQDKKLKKDNERLSSLKKKSDKDYNDFTDGHLYQ